MTDTWLPFATRAPGPDWKQGYPGVPNRTLDLLEGEVQHSAEGYRAGLRSVLHGPDTTSWTGTVYQVGPPEQHYPLESIIWGAGVKGDRRFDTSLIGNLTLSQWEVEGVAGEAWTANQLHYVTMISVATRAVCPQYRKNPPTLRVNLFEHGWLSNTSCPSGRNPWQALIAAINAAEEEDSMSKFIRAPDGRLFLTDGVFRNYIPQGSDRINDAKKLFGEPVQVGSAFVADLRISNPILSAKDIRAIVHKAVRAELDATVATLGVDDGS